MKKFLDTAPFIYYLEDNEKYAQKVEELIAEAINEYDLLATSVISILEFGVKPFREDKLELIQKFKAFLKDLDIEILPIDEIIVEEAYKLRANYGFLKGLDALQLAAAIIHNCDEFISNDKVLGQIREIRVRLLEE